MYNDTDDYDVNKYSIYLNSKVLKTGLVLADLPGKSIPMTIVYGSIIDVSKRTAGYKLGKSESNTGLYPEMQ